MTCKEKYMKDYPDADVDWHIHFKCPSDYGYSPDPRNCDAATDTEAMPCEECWNREIPEENPISADDVKKVLDSEPVIENIEMTADGLKATYTIDNDKAVILDSGNRREFETGAVRDIQEGKGRCDLMPLDMVAEFVSVAIGSSAHTVLHNIAGFKETGDEDYLYNALKKHPWRGLIDEERPGINYAPTCTMFLEVAKHFEEGAKKYGENNWQKGIPVHCYIDSAVRHYLKYLRGDKDEPHDRAFVWNVLCCIWTCIHKPELNEYRKENE